MPVRPSAASTVTPGETAGVVRALPHPEAAENARRLPPGGRRAGKPVPLRAADARYPGGTEHLHAVRMAVRELLEDWPLRDEAVLCASELAANAVLHSRSGRPGGEFAVRVAQDPDDGIRIEVQDEGGSWNLTAHEVTRGHGLDIVHRLAADWGIEGDYRGRAIWARLDSSSIAATAITGHPVSRAAENLSGLSPACLVTAVRNLTGGHRWLPIIDGHRLRHLRRLHGMSQEQLAHRAAVSVTTVTRLERPPRAPCRSRTMAVIAAALGEHPAGLVSAFVPPAVSGTSESR